MNRDVQTRRRLPHWYMPNAMHFVTFRLAGTIPNDILESLRNRKAALLARRAHGESRAQQRERVHKQLFAEYDRHLDRNCDVHWLDQPQIAALIRRSLYHWNGSRYHLACWCVMPNHAHVLFQPIGFDHGVASAGTDPGESQDALNPLSEIMHGLKGYTAHEANRMLGRTGGFWQHESYDHWVRDEDELERIVQYINANPVKAGLAQRSHEFHWSSAHDRFLHDGDTSGWLPP